LVTAGLPVTKISVIPAEEKFSSVGKHSELAKLGRMMVNSRLTNLFPSFRVLKGFADDLLD
jgi:hypothetical protein